jgi:enoyl-CoA hydratase
MIYQNIKSDTDEHIAIITINRPDKLNALNEQTINELKEVFTELGADENIRAIILTGAGEKAFVAGADISELNGLDVIKGKEFAEKGQLVFNLIENLGKPVIAAINGFALGGGCELALACHFRVASVNAKFGQPEVNLGAIPGFGGTQRLTRLINSGRALEMILTADIIDASEALRIGLVNHVYPQNELITKALEIAGRISSKAPIAVKYAIKAVKKAYEVSLQDGQKYEAGLFALCCGSNDFKEGTTAFLEKRKPDFSNK